MTRIINRLVVVTTGPENVPVAFMWDGCRYRVREVLDCWLEAGRWWEQEGEQKTYRVTTDNRGLFELSWNERQKRWYLYKAYD